jgi:hypothetical protein
MTKECSDIIQKKLPQKKKDPWSFTIPCSIGNITVGRALCDLGASINLMPLSMMKRSNRFLSLNLILISFPFYSKNLILINPPPPFTFCQLNYVWFQSTAFDSLQSLRKMIFILLLYGYLVHLLNFHH